MVNFVTLARRWPHLMMYWENVERKLPTYCNPKKNYYFFKEIKFYTAFITIMLFGKTLCLLNSVPGTGTWVLIHLNFFVVAYSVVRTFTDCIWLRSWCCVCTSTQCLHSLWNQTKNNIKLSWFLFLSGFLLLLLCWVGPWRLSLAFDIICGPLEFNARCAAALFMLFGSIAAHMMDWLQPSTPCQLQLVFFAVSSARAKRIWKVIFARLGLNCILLHRTMAAGRHSSWNW